MISFHLKIKKNHTKTSFLFPFLLSIHSDKFSQLSKGYQIVNEHENKYIKGHKTSERDIFIKNEYFPVQAHSPSSNAKLNTYSAR